MKKQKAIYGIIGYPVEHSLSPFMHNAAFEALEVDAEYHLFPLKEEELGAFSQSLRDSASPIFGLNVTVPYKEKIVTMMDSLNPLAQKIGAVNTIVISKQRKFIGYNTDAPGFMAHLAELQFSPENKNIAILGAGGSARAIVATLCMVPDRPKSIRIYNRSEERLETLLSDLGRKFNLNIVEPVHSIDDLISQDCHLLINTTSVGMHKFDIPLISEELLHRDMLVYDVIYQPQETPLLTMAKKKGAQISNGLGMLFYQGVLSLERWANIRLDDQVKFAMRQALEGAVRRE